MLADMLTLRNAVTISRITETADGKGGVTTTTTTATLARAQIWQTNSYNRFLSDKVTKDSSHVLALETGKYTFNDLDNVVTFGTHTYKTVGHADDVANQGEITVIGLQELT